MKGSAIISAKLNIYLNFQGNCAEVLDLYANIFQTAPSRTTYGDAPGGSPVPGWDDKIMHAEMRIGGTDVMFSDCPPDTPFVLGSNFVMTYGNTDTEELHRVFNALAADGHVIQHLAKTFFSELFGMVTDKFGITWNFIA